MKTKWYARGSTGIANGPTLGEDGTDFVAFVQELEDKKRQKLVQELIALLPELVDAADTMLGLARVNRNTVPTVKAVFADHASVIRHAHKLLNQVTNGGAQ